MPSLAVAWNRFWFEPAPPIAMGIYRIIFGLTVLLYGAFLSVDLLTFLSDAGVHPLSTYWRLQVPPQINVLVWLPPGPGWLIGFFVLFMLAAASLTLGWMTRLSAVLVWVGLVSLQCRNGSILNCSDNLLRMAAFFVMLSDSGAIFSLDRLAHRDKPVRPVPPWPQRMLQIQLCLAYFSTFLLKMTGPLWRNGTAVYYTSRDLSTSGFPLAYVFEHMWTIHLMTWGVMALELSLATLIWWRTLRPTLLVLGLLFHLTLDYTMNLPLMEWVFMGVYVLFVDAPVLEAWLGGMSRLVTLVPRPGRGPAADHKFP